MTSEALSSDRHRGELPNIEIPSTETAEENSSSKAESRPEAEPQGQLDTAAAQGGQLDAFEARKYRMQCDGRWIHGLEPAQDAQWISCSRPAMYSMASTLKGMWEDDHKNPIVQQWLGQLHCSHKTDLPALIGDAVDKIAVHYLSGAQDGITGAGALSPSQLRFVSTGEDCTKTVLKTSDGQHYLAPLKTTADGNCLVHAVSMSIFGTEVCYQMLRAMLAKELVDNKDYYCHFLDIGESAFTEAVEDASNYHALGTGDVRDGQLKMDSARFLEAIHITALAAVVNRPITVFASAAHMLPGSGFGGNFGTFVPRQHVQQSKKWTAWRRKRENGTQNAEGEAEDAATREPVGEDGDVDTAEETVLEDEEYTLVYKGVPSAQSQTKGEYELCEGLINGCRHWKQKDGDLHLFWSPFWRNNRYTCNASWEEQTHFDPAMALKVANDATLWTDLPRETQLSFLSLFRQVLVTAQEDEADVDMTSPAGASSSSDGMSSDDTEDETDCVLEEDGACGDACGDSAVSVARRKRATRDAATEAKNERLGAEVLESLSEQGLVFGLINQDMIEHTKPALKEMVGKAVAVVFAAVTPVQSDLLCMEIVRVMSDTCSVRAMRGEWVLVNLKYGPVEEGSKGPEGISWDYHRKDGGGTFPSVVSDDDDDDDDDVPDWYAPTLSRTRSRKRSRRMRKQKGVATSVFGSTCAADQDYEHSCAQPADHLRGLVAAGTISHTKAQQAWKVCPLHTKKELHPGDCYSYDPAKYYGKWEIGRVSVQAASSKDGMKADMQVCGHWRNAFMVDDTNGQTPPLDKPGEWFFFCGSTWQSPEARHATVEKQQKRWQVLQQLAEEAPEVNELFGYLSLAQRVALFMQVDGQQWPQYKFTTQMSKTQIDTDADSVAADVATVGPVAMDLTGGDAINSAEAREQLLQQAATFLYGDFNGIDVGSYGMTMPDHDAAAVEHGEPPSLPVFVRAGKRPQAPPVVIAWSQMSLHFVPLCEVRTGNGSGSDSTLQTAGSARWDVLPVEMDESLGWLHHCLQQPARPADEEANEQTDESHPEDMLVFGHRSSARSAFIGELQSKLMKARATAVPSRSPSRTAAGTSAAAATGAPAKLPLKPSEEPRSDNNAPETAAATSGQIQASVAEMSREQQQELLKFLQAQLVENAAETEAETAAPA
jgi:hypothetical protein